MAVSTTPSDSHTGDASQTPLICPMCGGANAHDAVFCANPKCHKSLGEFEYVLEELKAEMLWHEHLAGRVTAFIGKPHFLGIHAIWFAVWVLVNTGVVAVTMKFDSTPFPLLGIILAMETIFITAFVLISQNRQNIHADKRAELDYEVNVREYRQIQHIHSDLAALSARMEKMQRDVDALRGDDPTSG